MKHRARKRFGQNFLHDPAIIARIVHAIAPKADDCIVEIGPGMGAISLPLAASVKTLHAIEIDRDLQAYLQTMPALQGKLDLLAQDALTVDYRQWGTALRVVGNLPYNISTPLLLHLLQYIDHIQDMHFMLQKEVVERMAAEPGTKTYGRLSVICQYYCHVEHLFTVPAHCFTPAPKVESAIVRLSPHTTAIYPPIARPALEAITARGFSMRRKTLANNLKGYLSAEQLRTLQIDPTQRPEQVAVADWVRLAQALTS
ncbi:MAG: 16S rRNA (adenine(1518)-N(6)/adenine(1519)-N(6))-dimethyltransferase RsmA [Legionellaceae bacterium]|nr:16S rRNA (adenine(1518)-N(6)/adenine(1519)-N(6))-dimethyltransferase RsmA [Legionellaceae bacterium]